MGISDYLKKLRNHVGHELLLVPCVSVFVQDQKGHVLLEQRADNLEWGLPGGALDPGENLETAAIREMREETGLTVKIGRLIGVYSDPEHSYYTYTNGDRVQAIITMFEAHVVSGQLRPDNHETLRLEYFPVDSLPDGVSPRQKVRIEDAMANRELAYIR